MRQDYYAYFTDENTKALRVTLQDHTTAKWTKSVRGGGEQGTDQRDIQKFKSAEFVELEIEYEDQTLARVCADGR
jgi:hypothetical protein